MTNKYKQIYDKSFKSKELNGTFKKVLRFINYTNKNLLNDLNNYGVNVKKISEKFNNKTSCDEFFKHGYSVSFFNDDELKNKTEKDLFDKLKNIVYGVYTSFIRGSACNHYCEVINYKNNNYRVYCTYYIHELYLIKCFDENVELNYTFLYYDNHEFSSIHVFEKACANSSFKDIIIDCIKNKTIDKKFEESCIDEYYDDYLDDIENKSVSCCICDISDNYRNGDLLLYHEFHIIVNILDKKTGKLNIYFHKEC